MKAKVQGCFANDRTYNLGVMTDPVVRSVQLEPFGHHGHDPLRLVLAQGSPVCQRGRGRKETPDTHQAG